MIPGTWLLTLDDVKLYLMNGNSSGQFKTKNSMNKKSFGKILFQFLKPKHEKYADSAAQL